MSQQRSRTERKIISLNDFGSDNSEVLLQTLIGRRHKLSLYMCRNSVKKVCKWKKLDIEKNDAPNYWKISNDTNKYYADIMNTKSDFSESEYNSVSKMRISYLNVEMSEISDVLI